MKHILKPVYDLVDHECRFTYFTSKSAAIKMVKAMNALAKIIEAPHRWRSAWAADNSGRYVVFTKYQSKVP